MVMGRRSSAVTGGRKPRVRGKSYVQNDEHDIASINRSPTCWNER